MPFDSDMQTDTIDVSWDRERSDDELRSFIDRRVGALDDLEVE